MSYILDAIKKSEGERVQTSEPEALSMQAGNAFRVTSRRSRTPWIAVAIAGAVAFAVWLFWPSISGVAGVVRSQINLDVNASGSSSGALSGGGQGDFSANGNDTGSSGQQSIRSESTLRNSPAPGSVNAGAAASSDGSFPRYAVDAALPPRNEIKELWQMPADFQAKIPTLNFSFHVYSETPHKRTIIINGRRMREGQMVTSKIKLRLITATGIILHGHERFFHVDVVEKW